MTNTFVRELILTEPDPQEPPLDFVTPNEVSKLLRELQTRKSVGPDQISNRLFKKISRKPLMALVAIYNAMLRFQTFPSAWKEAEVIFLHKPHKDPTLPQNYRPISLLSVVGKIGEKIIKSRLAKVTEELQIIPEAQFGFREKQSTTHQVLRVTEVALRNFNIRRFTGMISLDVAKAFDSVWHNGLLFKLNRFGVPAKLIRLLHSYLLNRCFRSKIGHSTSALHALEAGVPQGSVLGPTLYTLFTPNISRPRDHRVELTIYADDTTIFSA